MMISLLQLMVAIRWVGLFADGKNLLGERGGVASAVLGAVAVGIGREEVSPKASRSRRRAIGRGHGDSGDVGGFFHDGEVDGGVFE